MKKLPANQRLIDKAASRAKRREAQRKLLWSSVRTLLTSVVAHIVLIAAAVAIVVNTLKSEPPPVTFQAQPKVSVAAKVRDQKMESAKHDAMAPKPSFSRKLTVNAPSKITLPKMPDIDLKQMLPLDPSALVSDQVAGLAGAAGMGRGTGAGVSGGGGTGTTGMAFFNLKDSAKSIVIMIDVSDSMFGRTGDYDYGTRKKLKEGADQNFQLVRTEAIKLVNSLKADCRFGIIHWSGSARTWKEELVRATDANKSEAKDYIQNQIDVHTAGPTKGRPGGTRHDYALEELFKLQPETAFMLTDGNATRSGAGASGRGVEVIPEKELVDQIDTAGKGMERLPRIHTIYYMTGRDVKTEEDLLKAIARKTQGKFSKVKAAGADGKK